MENQHRMISGYRELDQEDIDLMNKAKQAEKALKVLVEGVKQSGADGRWTSIAQTHFDQGFMALVRAIAKPN